MWSKRVYKCLYNNVTNNFEAHVTDEGGLSIRIINTGSSKEALTFFYAIRNTLLKNNRVEIKQINDFHFECKKIKGVKSLLKIS